MTPFAHAVGGTSDAACGIPLHLGANSANALHDVVSSRAPATCGSARLRIHLKWSPPPRIRTMLPHETRNRRVGGTVSALRLSALAGR
jgi:hypothetical protein